MKQPISALILLALLTTWTGPGSALCVLRLDERGQVLEKGHTLARKTADTPRQRTDRALDVTLYDLDLTVTADEEFLVGAVEITFDALDDPTNPGVNPLAAAVFDFANDHMTISALLVDGVTAVYTHQDDLISIPLSPPRPPGSTVVVRVEYSGTISTARYGLNAYRGGYRVRHFADDMGTPDPTQPVIASLSEPDAARAWWPCHDTPFDAAAVRLSVTGPSDMSLAAPGLRTADEDLGGGLRRQAYWMPTEIPSYLVSVAMARYATEAGQPYTWRDTAMVRLDEQQPAVPMPVEYYATPSLEAAARVSWSTTPLMLETFDAAFGPYPYSDLKYGMAMFVFGGAMEHPTISSMSSRVVSEEPSERTGGPGFEWITAHEMGHQWFGDCVRVPRWGEIWLNEGFASYCEVLWYEFQYGYDVGKQWLIDDKRHDSFGTTILDPEGPLFGTTVYRKGAWFLHMLRQVLGVDPSDTEQPIGLVRAMKNYVTDPALRFSTVESADFQRHCEEVLRTRGRQDYLVDDSLDWMFVPWLNREGRPELRVEWFQNADEVSIVVRQAADNAYRLPLPIRLRYDDDSTEDLQLWIDGVRSAEVLTGRGAVAALEVDPEQDWLINHSVGVTPVGLAEVYPNPFNPALNVEFFLDRPQSIALDVFDIRGRHVKQLATGGFGLGLFISRWDGDDDRGRRVASGVYYVQLRTAAGQVETRKATLLK